MATRITVICENTAGVQGVEGEAGLSILVERCDRRILFDAGAGRTLCPNAARLGVDLKALDAIVLSHGHFDHTGGLAQAVELAAHATLFMHPAALAERCYGRNPATPAGMPAEARQRLAALGPGRIVWTEGPTEILGSGVFATGAIPRRNDFEDTGGVFSLDADVRQLDPIADDQALYVPTASGLIVILGCAHAGLINTLDCVRDLGGQQRVRLVLGGTHLLNADAARMERTIAALRACDPASLMCCHCTGCAAEAIVRAFPDVAATCAAGSVLDLAD